MSIDKVEITNPQGDLLALTLDDISNGFIVMDIGGLDPVKATMVTSNFASLPGAQYQSSNREARFVTFKLGYNPDYTVDQTIRSLRSRLYDFFMSDTPVVLTFYMTDGITVKIAGRVESCEAPLFTKEPVLDISIECFDPDFVSTELVQLHSTFTTTDSVPHIINVTGSVPTGLTMLTFTAARTLSEFTIYNTLPSGLQQSMLISAPLVIGDVIRLCTVRGQKSITMTRGNVTTSLLWAVSPQSDWVVLGKGANQFYLNASTTNPSPVSVDFYNRYGGL